MSTTRTSGRQLSERQGSGMSRRGRRFVAAVTAVMLALPVMGGAFSFSAPAYADDLTNTVPKTSDGYETVDGNDFYSGTINTGFVPNNYTTAAQYGPSYGPYTVPGVYQSQSTTSATSFAAGLPLGTIYIDQSKITESGGTYKVVSDNTAIIAGLGRAEMTDGLTMGYDGTKEGAIKMVPGKINKLDGDLFTVTYKDAAVLPNGERADFVITYSNAQIVIDQRYLAAPDGTKYYQLTRWAAPNYTTGLTGLTRVTGETLNGNPVFIDSKGDKYERRTEPNASGTGTTNRYYRIIYIGPDALDLDPSTLTDSGRTYDYYGENCPIYTDTAGNEYIKPGNHQYYHGSVGLAQGNSIRRTGTDKTSFRNAHYVEQARAIVNDTASEFGNSYYDVNGNPGDSGGNASPVTGTILDVTYKVVNKDGTPAAGTFVFGICGVNLDRDPDSVGANNLAKPIWYSYTDNFGGENGKEHSFFSEAVEILEGQVSDYVYVRPNNNLEDNPAQITGVKGRYFWPNVSLHDGNIKFIGNQISSPSLGGNDASYNAGFVTLANAATGFTIRSSGHGGAGGGMNSVVFNSKQIWYRYTESTGKHGSIAVTSEGNFGGTLDDGGAVYKPEGTWDKGSSWNGVGTPSGVGEAATHVVAEGKTVTYTMTPDIGYKISKLWVGAEWNDDKSPIKYREITFDGDAIAAMKKGDTQEIETAAGNKGLLTYNEDGTYTLTFEYAQNHEAVHVEWEPTTADILVAKVWDDKDDKDGLRAAAYRDPATTPNVKLQWFIGGKWEDVPASELPSWTRRPDPDVNPREVPSGEDTSGKYLDGRYEINKDTTGKHPFTWEYLPVYSYDRNGVADRLITYRIVEEPDLTSSDYKDPEYFDGQSFTLDSSMTKSRDGFQQFYTDGTTKYVKKGDGKYYEVDAHENSGKNPAAPQPDPDSLTGVTLDPSDYYTVDKGTPYQTIDVRNEHKPNEIYIEFTKNWNDAAIQEMDTTEENGNKYARKPLKFTLHGTIIDANGSEKTVDLNVDDADEKDIVVEISTNEADGKAEAIGRVEGYDVVTDGSTNYVLRNAGDGEQYYTYTANADGTYSYTVASPQPTAADLNPVTGDGTYKIDDYNFGALIENLPTHSEGKLITYTLTETDSADKTLDGNGWIVTGGQLTPGYDSNGKLKNYTTQFVNTPEIDDTTSPLPVTIQKKDAVTKGSLEGAIFTVYTNAVSKTKASESATEEIGGKTVYTDGTTKYVLQDDGGEDKYFSVAADGTVAPTAADPQPNPANLAESKTTTTETVEGQTVYTDGTTKYVLRGGVYYTYKDNGDGTYTYTKAANQNAGTMRQSQLKGAVDENEVVTNANGQVTINFNKPGTYYVVETKAPTGYEVDPKVYTFVVEENLKSVTFKDVDNPERDWWEVIYELLFGNGMTFAENWTPSDSGGVSGTLTVENDPIRANILINKIWDDNNNQDGLRNTSDLPKVKLEKTTNPADETSWTAVNSQAVPAVDKVIPNYDAPITVDPDNYYTWGDLPAYENGKLIYYRVKEFGGTLPNGGVFLPTGDHPEDNGYAWTALTATGNEKEFNIANITDPANPTSRNRTVTVTNKHVPQTITLNVSKDWADDEDDAPEYKYRKTADITLYKTVNGAEFVVETRTGVVPLEDEKNFTVFENLPVYENGNLITYRVEETAINHYGTTYKRSYETNTAVVDGEEGDSIDPSTVKRTFGPEKIGDYPVYVDGSGNQYAYVTGEAGTTDGYYAVSGDTIDYDAPYAGDTSELTVTREETTEAEIEVKNAKLTEVLVEKTWYNGATENAIYYVYRTISTDPAVIDWEQAKRGTQSVLNDTETVYNWNPENDSNWEQVLDEDGQPLAVAFPANLFENKTKAEGGSTKEYTIPNVPVADPDGNRYVYRVHELDSHTVEKFEANQVSNTKIENTNARAHDGIVHVNVVKELEGREWNNNDRFYFKIEPYRDGDKDSVDYGHAGAFGVDQNGDPITDATKVPLPKDSNNNSKDIQDVMKSSPQVGAIGRNVAFTPIRYTSADIDMGKSAEYYYKVYEVYDAQGTDLDEATEHTGKKAGIAYDGKVVSGEFKPTEHTLKVTVNSDATGVITTALYWDGSEIPSAVPVYTNTYDAVAKVNAHIIKEIRGREIIGNDEFNFSITNIGGAPLRANENDDAIIEAGTHDAGSIEKNTGSKVTGTGAYNPVGGDNGSFRAIKSESTNWYKVGDLSQKTPDGRATDIFIYRIIENPEGTGATDSKANDGDLDFDSRHIYIKVVATDNLDGTIDIQKSYWYDEMCSSQPVGASVLVDSEGNIAPADATSDDEDGEGNKLYHYEPAAIFTNNQTIDIPVVKEWKGAPAVEDVTLRLKRKLIPLSAEAGLTYSDAENAEGYNNKGWEDVGNVTTALRSDFFKDDGTPNYNALSPLTARKTYENVDGFNMNLPKYVTVDGTTYRAVYKLFEDPTSDAYETTYYSKKGDAKTDDNRIFIDGETLVVTNTVTATNEANIAAVKQLLGRQWLGRDDFEFTLKPAGKGTYKADGSFNTIDSSDDAKATVPMPENNTDRQSETTGTGKDTVATTHAWDDANNANSIVVDQNGNLERLARFGAIKFDINDLTWVNNHYEGDFFYTVEEKVPDDAENAAGVKYSEATAAQKAAGGFVKDGITYDGTSHDVHVKVQGNRTNQLYVQIAYDEKTVGDASTGTQFTPVYTNRYDAVGTQNAQINKYIMGRGFTEGETFTFKITPLGDTPMVDAETGDRLDSREGTITVSDASKTVQSLTLPDIKFILDDLPWTVGANGAVDARDGTAGPLTYSDGTTTPVAGMKYGRFMYAFTEKSASASDLTRDTDTEYVQVTVIDKGDGTLDTQVAYFEDRYGTVPRIEPGTTDTPATATVFVNKLTRDLTVTKAWDAPATSDVTLKLQWSTDNGATWNDADGTSWLADFPATQTIEQAGNELTVEWEDLPAYAPDTDDIDLNDKWVRYRVVEDDIANVTTRYSTEAYANGDKADNAKYSTDPIATEAAATDTRVTQIYVTNFVEDLEGTASVNVVKQLIGRGWTDSDSFGFTITPVESKIGKETTAKPASERAMPMPMGTDDNDNPVVDNTATATKTGSRLVTVGEYNATFENIVIKLSDLALNDKNIATGEFVYTIKEAIPEGATPITDTNGKTLYYVKGNIKYTAEEHTVKIVATNDGTGTIDTTVSYDDRPAGDFVPVYTNEAIVTTPIKGSKTWVGGEASEHINANGEGVDARGITLWRKTSADTDWTPLGRDDADRKLVVVWDNATGNSDYTVMAKKVTTDPDTGDETTENVNPVLDMMDNDGYKYEYRISEGNVPDNYADTYATSDVTNNDITNTSTKKDSLKVTKTWDDGDNVEGLRPDKVVMHLYKRVSGSNVLVEVASQEIPKGAEGTGITWDNLPVYDNKDGNKITYVVIEENEFGYTTTYKVLSDSTVTGYTDTGNSLTLDGDKTAEVQTIDVKNKLTPATDTVTVTKVWNDDNDRDGNRPPSVSVNVYEHVWTDATDDDPARYVKNTTPVDTLTLNATGNWMGTVTDLPRTKNGRTVFYTVEEDTTGSAFGAAGTEGKYSNVPLVTGNQTNGFTVTNNYTPETIDIQATKVWGDLALQLLAPFGYDRPTTVSFQLKADGTAVGTPVAISKDSTVGTTEWAYQWADLPKKKLDGEGNSVAINYTVEELEVPGYTSTVTGNMTDGFTVTNTVEKNGVTVKKQFLDAETGEPIPASSIPTDFVIHANYTAVEEDDNGDMARVVKDVQLKIADATGPDANGTYTWTLNDVVKGTTVHVHENNYRDANKYTFTQVTTTGPDANAKIHTDDTNFVMPDGAATVSFVNEYTKQKGNLELVKNWNDDSDRDRARPQNVSFTVTATVGDDNDPAPVFATADEPTKNTTTVTLTGGKTDASWSDKSLTNLPLYDADGNQITYTLSEGTVPEGYFKSLGNPYTPLTSGATETLSITNTHIPAMDSLTVTKAWSDNNDAAGLRPDSVTFHLYKTVNGADVSAGVAPKPVNADSSWTATWTGLPVYENGEKITYKVVEEAVAGYKTPTVAPANIKLDAENGAQEVTVTNEPVSETTEVTVTKNWNDNNNQDGLRRPATVTLRERVWNKTSGQYGTATDVDTGTLSVANDATVTFSDLPAIKNGKPVMYSVVEAQVPNYEAPVVTGNQVDGFTVTNTHKPAKGCVEVQKIWDDNNNQDGKRTDVTVTLKSTVGTGDNENTIEVGSKVISADMNKPQEAEWHNLPVFRDGKKITYTVEEAPIEGYDDPIYSDGVQLANDGDTKTLTVTNEYTPATTKLTVTKKWSDGNNQDGMRANVTLHLKGTIEGSDFALTFDDKTIAKDATAADNAAAGTATWTGLPVYHNGKKITYEVTEEALPGYSVSGGTIATDATTGEMTAELLNTRTPAVTSVSVTKVWNDGNNVDGKRKNVTVRLLANGNPAVDTEGNEMGEAILAQGTNHDQNMTATWSRLPAYKDGQPIVYTVSEEAIEGYTPQITGDQENGFTITNVHPVETINIQATKVWNDAALMNEDGTAPIKGYDRPKTVSLQLKADGTAVGAPVAVSKSSKVGNTEWAYQWTGLPKYKNGQAIAYTVEEVEIPDGYTVEVTGTMADGFTVTNTPDVAEVLGADLIVKKIDKSTGKPMEGVTFTLTSNIENFTTVTQTTNDGGVAAFAFDEIGTYTLTETVPDGYENPDPASYTITVSKNSSDVHVELEPSRRNKFQKVYDLLFNGGGANYDANTKTLTVENTPKTSNVTVRKQFVDADTHAFIPASSIPDNFVIHADYMTLDENGVAVESTARLELSDALVSDGTYRWTLAGVVYGTDVHVHETKYLNVTGYDFKSTEVTAPDGAKTHDDDASFTMPDEGAMVTFVNEYTKQTGDLELVKNWNDDSNRDRARPQNVSFTVTASAPVFGTAEEPSTTKAVTLTGDATADSWSNKTLTGLPLYYNGEKVTYTVDEAVVTGYTKIIDQATGVTLTKDATKKLSITNTYVPQTDRLTVTKLWDDSDDAAGLRPDKVTFHLYKVSGSSETSAGVDAKTIPGDAADDALSVTWAGLPVYDANGTKITYKVVEEAVAGYTTTYTDKQTIELDGDKTADPQAITVTNSLTPATTSVNVTKVWDDGNNVDGTRKAATVTLYKQEWNKTAGQYGDAVSTGQTKTLAVTDNARVSFENLTANANGKPIIYSVRETRVEGYNEPVVAGDQKTGFTITNTHVPNTRVITVTKAWDDAGMTAANYQRPKDISVNLFANGTAVGEARGLSEGNSWATSWTVPVNDADGAIEYVVKELNTPTGYTYSGDVTVTGTGDQSVTITNTAKLDDEKYNPFEITVRKTNLKGELLPGATFKLEGPDNYQVNATSDADGRFTLTFPKDGTYTLTETAAPTGYKVNGEPITIEISKQLSEINLQTGSGLWANIYNLFVGGTPPEGWDAANKTLTLTNEPKTYTINAYKYLDGIDTLPDNFAFELTYTDARGVSQVVTNTSADSTISDNGKVGKVFTFENIPFNSEVSIRETGYQVTGKAVSTEVTTNAPNAVTASDSASFTMPNGSSAVYFTNTYVDTGDVTIPVAKVWDDANNQDSKRPETVTFRLFADGKDTGKTVTLGVADVDTENANRWAKAEAFTVPGFDDAGTPITYTVREDVSRELATAGYTDSGEAGVDENYTITNTLTPNSGEVLGDETWGGINEAQTGEIDWNVNPRNPVTPGSLVAPEGATTNGDGTVTVAGGTYTLNSDGTVTFAPKANWYGDPTPITVKGTDRQDNEVTATYTPHVVNNIETDDVTRTITYSYAKDGSQAADMVTQTVSFTRTGTVNPDTGEVTYKADGSDWTVVGNNPDAANFAEVDSPDIRGYNPDRKSVPAVTVKPGDDDIAEKVVYSDQVVLNPREITVLKVDKKTGNPLAGAEFTLSDPYGTVFPPKTTGEDGTVTFTLDAKGGWTLVETGVPENHKLGDVYSWTIKARVDEDNVTIEGVTEGEDTIWKKIVEVIVDLTADGFNAETNTLTVENPPIDEKTITYVNPDPENPSNVEKIQEDIIKVGEDEPAQPANPTRDGYNFGGWLREMDDNGNVTYKANWIEIPDPGEKVIQYVDPSKPEGEQEVLREVITRGANEPAQPADPTRDGWKFTGWKRTIDDDGNVTYTATWEEIPKPERITVTYNPANGEDVTTETINRNENEPAQPADPTRNGFTFVGWQRVEDENGNVTYTARWKEIPPAEQITVTYDPDNGEDKTETIIERGKNEPAQPADPQRDGFIFGGWIRTMDDDGNVTYKARWIKIPDPTERITITRDPGNGEPPTTVEIMRGEDEPAQPGDPMRDGYEFSGWDRTVDPATGNVIYKARWKKLDLTDAITITYDPANGESASSTHIERGSNEPGQPANPTRDGYIFGGWLRTMDEDGNVTYTANWIETTTPDPEKITVTYDADNGTDPIVSTIERGENEPGQPANPTRDGYIFGGWLRTMDEDGNVIYKAHWIDSTMCPTPTPTGSPNGPTTPGGDPTAPGGTPDETLNKPPAVSERPLSAIPLSNTGEAVGTAGMAALMLALLGGGLLTLRRQRAMNEER